MLLSLLSITFSSSSAENAATANQRVVGWRGDGTGIFAAAKPAMEWNGPKKLNVLWSTKIGELGHSSPAVVGERVFVTCAPAELICLDANTGKILWQHSNGFAYLEPKMPDRPVKGLAGNIVPTPVSDGRHVYAVFGNGIVACYTVDGKREWMRFYDWPPAPEYGRTASPLLLGDRLIVSMRCLAALNARNGDIVWRAQRATETNGTPAIAKVGNVDVAVTAGGHVVRLSDGAVIANDLASTSYVSPIIVGDVAYIIDGTAKAYRLSSSGTDAVSVKQIWEADLDGEFFASPVYLDRIVYTVNNDGKCYGLDAASGKIVIEKELAIPNNMTKAPVTPAHVYPSLCVAGGRIFVGNDAGDMLVLEGGKLLNQLARNRLGEGSGASPAFAGTRIFLRAGEKLYCIGSPMQ